MPYETTHHPRHQLDTTYLRRLERVVSRYALKAAPDGGFGLTASQGTSLVNTAEALFVLRVAHLHNINVSLEVVDAALKYLSTSLPNHCAPRTKAGGRGEKTRFVLFTLGGLSWWPERLPTGANATLEWAVKWLEDNQLGDGLPEEASIQDMSLFQTAIALWILPNICPLLSDQAFIRSSIEDYARGISYHAHPSGGWPRITYVLGTSPSKTALSVIGLQKALDAGMIPSELQFGGAEGEPVAWHVSDRLASAAEWLQQNMLKWIDFIEADPDVPGTQWSHLSYALSLEAIAIAGNPASGALIPGWASLNKTWGRQFDGWCEPTNPPSPSIRADFAVVRAYEAMFRMYGSGGLRELGHRISEKSSGRSPDYDLVVSRLDQPIIRPLQGGREPVSLELTERHRGVLLALADGPGEPRWWTTTELAEKLSVGESSVGNLVGRLRSAIKKSVSGYDPIVSQRGLGYRLNVRSIRRTD